MTATTPRGSPGSPGSSATASCDPSEVLLSGEGSCAVGGMRAYGRPSQDAKTWTVHCAVNTDVTSTAVCCRF